MKDQSIRVFVVSFLHWNGKNYGKLTHAQEIRVRALADGFGPGVDPETEPDMFWDWSHVRDSSEEAFVAMAQTLESQGYRRYA